MKIFELNPFTFLIFFWTMYIMASCLPAGIISSKKGPISSIKYGCVQGALHCQSAAHKVAIQVKKLPGTFKEKPPAERVKTNYEIVQHKEKINGIQEKIKLNRKTRADAKN